MKQMLCHMEYFGLLLSFILPHLVSILYHKKSSPDDSGDESLNCGDELQIYTCGMRISVVKAPSSELRLR